MTGKPDPKPAPRVVDPTAARRAHLTGGGCVACGAEAGSAHHVLPRSERGDDVDENLVLLCGSGTTRCHGAWHGNPYVARLMVGAGHTFRHERRDREWVATRIGWHLIGKVPSDCGFCKGEPVGDAATWVDGKPRPPLPCPRCGRSTVGRPDTIAYLLAKLGDDPGRAYLERVYLLTLPAEVSSPS